jgi:hypothetical protein
MPAPYLRSGIRKEVRKGKAAYIRRPYLGEDVAD